jgi:hypothetical protein
MGPEDNRPLQPGEAGPYAAISRRPNPDRYAIVFIPSLAALLTRAAELKGGDLTREEVLHVRDACQVLVTDQGSVQAIEERRGYPDLNPVECYEDWLRLKGRTSDPGETGPGRSG